MNISLWANLSLCTSSILSISGYPAGTWRCRRKPQTSIADRLSFGFTTMLLTHNSHTSLLYNSHLNMPSFKDIKLVNDFLRHWSQTKKNHRFEWFSQAWFYKWMLFLTLTHFFWGFRTYFCLLWKCFNIFKNSPWILYSLEKTPVIFFPHLLN